ncbi:MAG: glycosyltransferase family 1 protein [Planctomycetota bacterium]|nr:MAG: glycosyltransferase family 1 protein [Planctomycetota bacterium]
MPAPAEVHVNARFLGEPLTGVQRVGREILAELDRMVAAGEIDRGRWRIVLHLPAPPAADPGLPHLELRPGGAFRSHAWEQLSLPRRAPGLLLNLKGTAPVRHPRTLLHLHDAVTFAWPQAYSRAFRAWWGWVVPRAARRARLLTAVSAFTAGEYERRFGIPRRRITVLPNGHEHVFAAAAEPAVLARLGLEPEGYVLAVGSLDPRKNLAGAAAAVRLAGVEGLRLVVAGGPNPRVFAERGAELPPGTVHAGRVSDGELRALYEHALALIFPSFYEGFGLPPLEAMALGCPVLASDAAALPEVCGRAALLAPPAADAERAEQLRTLAADPALRAELRAKGRAQAAGFTWRACARGMWRLVTAELERS